MADDADGSVPDFILARQEMMRSLQHFGDRPDDGHTPGPLEQMFWDNQGPAVHKWLHYLPLYDRYLAPYRERPVRMLEIGVFKGGSLALWRRYLGPAATIFGIDIDPDCAAFDGQHGQVRIGSQDDPAFLADVIAEMGGVDIVLDDGSHDSRHIRTSFRALFPHLSDGGLYMIEDLHAAYWPDYSGGYDAPESFMNEVRMLIDDMHHWYHDQGERIAAAAGHVAGLHIHDSLVVIEKQAVAPPRHTVRSNRARARALAARAGQSGGITPS
jgi:hypothetical protein